MGTTYHRFASSHTLGRKHNGRSAGKCSLGKAGNAGKISVATHVVESATITGRSVDPPPPQTCTPYFHEPTSANTYIRAQ